MSRRFILLLLSSFLAVPAEAATLAEALAQAWSRHPQARATAAREAAAQAGTEVAAALTPGPPALSLSNLNDRLDRNRGRQEWEIEMAVPLWLPGQKAARENAAASVLAETAARRDALRWQLAGELREAWWALAAARQQSALAERRAAAARALADDVRRRFAAGDLARVDANMAQSERLAADAEALDAQTGLRQAEQVYRHLTGAEAPAELAAEMPAAALATAAHPQLAAVAAAARVARDRLKLAEESRREAPELAVRMQRERGEFGAAYGNSVGVKLTLPFASAPRQAQETSAAQAEAVQADAELALLRQKFALDLERVRREAELAERQLAMARERRELAADSLRLAEKSFTLGEADLSTLLRTRRAAFEAEAAFARQEVARAASVSRLNHVSGVLP